MLWTATKVSIVPKIGRAPRESRTGKRHSARPHVRPRRRKNPLRISPLNRGLVSDLACKSEELIGDSEGNITAVSQRLQTEACLRPSQANAITAATNNAANAVGKASASVSAVTGARPKKTNASAGAPVTRNSAVTIRPAPSSSPLVAASDPDMKAAIATTAHAAASTRQ